MNSSHIASSVVSRFRFRARGVSLSAPLPSSSSSSSLIVSAFTNFCFPLSSLFLFLTSNFNSSGTRLLVGPGMSLVSSCFRQTGQTPLTLRLLGASSRLCSIDQLRVSMMQRWQKTCPQIVDVASVGTSIHTGHLYAVNGVRPASVPGFCESIASSRCFASAAESAALSSTPVRSTDSIVGSAGGDEAWCRVLLDEEERGGDISGEGFRDRVWMWSRFLACIRSQLEWFSRWRFMAS